MGVICHSVREACDTTRVTASGTEVGEMPLLNKNSQGPKAGRTTTEGEHRGAREGSTWVFCLDPRGPMSRHGGWGEGRRRCRVQGAPFYARQGRCRKQSPESLRSYYLPLQSRGKAGCLGPGDTALPWLEGCSVPTGPPERTNGEPRWGGLQPPDP